MDKVSAELLYLRGVKIVLMLTWKMFRYIGPLQFVRPLQKWEDYKLIKLIKNIKEKRCGS